MALDLADISSAANQNYEYRRSSLAQSFPVGRKCTRYDNQFSTDLKIPSQPFGWLSAGHATVWTRQPNDMCVATDMGSDLGSITKRWPSNILQETFHRTTHVKHLPRFGCGMTRSADDSRIIHT